MERSLVNSRADSPIAKTLLKYQPNNLALLVDEKTITDEVLNENSDFYALYLELKRAKTPTAMHEAINKYKDVLALPEHKELLKMVFFPSSYETNSYDYCDIF